MKTASKSINKRSRGVSIGEIIMIVVLISILAIILVPRFLSVSQDAKYEACRANVANINALVQLYYIKEGTWTDLNMNAIKNNANYFPELTVPDCPITPGAKYYLYPTGHRVTGHLRNQPTHPF